jgi:hypothetical protein
MENPFRIQNTLKRRLGVFAYCRKYKSILHVADQDIGFAVMHKGNSRTIG